MADRPLAPLPMDGTIPEVLEAIAGRRSAVVVAPPGSGKTTRLPPAIVRSGLLAPGHPRVFLLQPRRIAARSVAARIAEEQGWALGQEVGYQVRFENRARASTRLRIMTEGILNRRLLDDPFLEGVGAVILDEFHERSIHSDLAIALLREVREAARDDLIVVAMSATIAAETVARFLGDCPIVRAEGKAFPVAIEHDPPDRRPLAERVAGAVDRRLALGGVGHVLVFLPGAEEIRRCAGALAPIATRHGLEVVPLHGSLPAEAQDRALRPSTRPKVILATNVAETSITVEGVTTVIDSGLERVAEFDAARGLDRLALSRISRASADQRADRAGRTGPGVCVRLWSLRDERAMPPFAAPEVARVDVAAAALTVFAWGADPRNFAWFEGPHPAALGAAVGLLESLGAVRERRLTPLGERLHRLPVPPRIGRLLLAADDDGAADVGAALAAVIDEKDLLGRRPLLDAAGPRPSATSSQASDVLRRLDVLREFEARGPVAARAAEPDLDLPAARRALALRDQLLRIVRPTAPAGASSADLPEEVPLRWLLRAFPDRVARRREAGGDRATLVGGRGIRLDPSSTVREAEFFLALDPRDDARPGAATREAIVRIASAIDPDWLLEDFPEQVRRERVTRFDPDRGRVVAHDRLVYRDLTIRESTHGQVEASEAAEAFSDYLSGRAEEVLRQNERAAAWLDRLSCLRGWCPDLDLPAFDGPALAEIVRDSCVGLRTLSEIRQVPWADRLAGRLTFAQARRFEAEAPEFVEVPSGSRIPLRYEPGRPPVLAVRVQEIFGWTATPRVAAGRVPVLLHLLGPNHRPVQVTDDLASFWANTYPQVRKDLRARYPKHAWPDDPRSARPEARGGRRRG